MGAGVLAAFEPVPVPGRPFLVVAADLVRLPVGCIGERRRQLDHRRPLRKWLGQVDDVDRTGDQALDKGRQGVHSRTQFTPPLIHAGNPATLSNAPGSWSVV